MNFAVNDVVMVKQNGRTILWPAVVTEQTGGSKYRIKFIWEEGEVCMEVTPHNDMRKSKIRPTSREKLERMILDIKKKNPGRRTQIEKLLLRDCAKALALITKQTQIGTPAKVSVPFEGGEGPSPDAMFASEGVSYPKDADIPVATENDERSEDYQKVVDISLVPVENKERIETNSMAGTYSVRSGALRVSSQQPTSNIEITGTPAEVPATPKDDEVPVPLEGGEELSIVAMDVDDCQKMADISPVESEERVEANLNSLVRDNEPQTETTWTTAEIPRERSEAPSADAMDEDEVVSKFMEGGDISETYVLETSKNGDEEDENDVDGDGEDEDNGKEEGSQRPKKESKASSAVDIDNVHIQHCIKAMKKWNQYEEFLEYRQFTGYGETPAKKLAVDKFIVSLVKRLEETVVVEGRTINSQERENLIGRGKSWLSKAKGRVEATETSRVAASRSRNARRKGSAS
ncbi:hypothetical protein D9757_011474 [Collybiopsis confluens]|uniref:Uncharacterized protein n=1 Tax=Collybiopsis confluens TaxID=2823264 RepID=A0A8H5GKF5_9AGAR|nr:hypothetical protein D9757_011474 [Collybiopsis confluens]